MSRAATTRLDPGQHSIDRTKPRRVDGGYQLDWSIRTHAGELKRKRTQAPTVGEVRARARATAETLLTSGGGGRWKPSSKTAEYVEAVSRPLIRDGALRPNTKSRYLAALDLLLGKCEAHKHAHGLGALALADATRFRALEACLQEVARLHGPETAHQARTVLSKYVLQQLIRDGVIQGHPLAGVQIDLAGGRPRGRQRGGQALRRDEYRRVLEHLLTLDPAEGVEAPVRGRWTMANRVAKRERIVDLTLLQATTGLRISEALLITWDLVCDDGQTMYIHITEEISKTHIARTVPVLDPRVADRLRRSRASSGGRGHVLAAPGGGAKHWDQNNAGRLIRELYPQLAEACDAPLLETARSHVWRATLNSLLLESVPEAVRAAYFGHDAAVNRTSYTDTTDTSGMLKAAAGLR